MTDHPRETLAHIRKQADAATDGPWEVLKERVVTEDMDLITPRLHCLPDAKFIAAARTAVPALLDLADAVLDLHKRQPSPDGDLCAECFPSVWNWPCPTVTTITQALEGETND